ncbi:Uncharacterized protein TCM_018528 [Theobroma cacao]|uniref:DUF4283 domain-containing protein n=1 Tax=Theobroma cacao TaxID=3641 RepID=A0A061EEM5_THECC|nr:Uncharacterized protein TCM_018528 [Theobroma cacao]
MVTGQSSDPPNPSLSVVAPFLRQPTSNPSALVDKTIQLQAIHGVQQVASSQNQAPTSPRFHRKSFLFIVIRGKASVIPITRDPVVYKDRHAVAFFEDKIQALAKPFMLSLVGKFTRMPKLAEIRLAFKGIGLAGAYEIGWLDYKHILIHLFNEHDFNWIWTKQNWFIANQKMWVFKCSLEIEAEKESPIVPIWISFPKLKAHLYEKLVLLLVAKIVGKPLFVDEATTKGSRPSVARICVEYDCRKLPVDQVWIVIQNRETGEVTKKLTVWCWEISPTYHNPRIRTKKHGQIEYVNSVTAGKEISLDVPLSTVRIEKAAISVAQSSTLEGEPFHGHGERNLTEKLTRMREAILIALLGGEESLAPAVERSALREKFKDYFTEPSARVATLLHRDGQQISESGLKSQNVSVDMLEGSGEHSSIDGQGASQIRCLVGHNWVDSTMACPCERMEGYDDNLPNLEFASGKFMYNKKLSTVPPFSGTNPVELEVHPLLWHKGHLDTATLIGRIISLASEEAVDMGENDGVSDDDSISSLAVEIHMPWIVGGDFNTILHSGERLNGAVPHEGCMEDFTVALLDCGLMDGGYEGNAFT